MIFLTAQIFRLPFQGGRNIDSHKEKGIEEGEEDVYISYYSPDIRLQGMGN